LAGLLWGLTILLLETQPPKKYFLQNSNACFFDRTTHWRFILQDARGLKRAERNFYRREDSRRKCSQSLASPFEWRRDGDDWILLAGRRRFGRVIPDRQYPGMWRSKVGGQLSDMANLSWAKNAVLAAAERELEWERHQRRATDPSKCPERGPVFSETAPPMRSFREAAE
jgi:hypothetical protein